MLYQVFTTLGPILRNYAKTIDEQMLLITAIEVNESCSLPVDVDSFHSFSNATKNYLLLGIGYPSRVCPTNFPNYNPLDVRLRHA